MLCLLACWAWVLANPWRYDPALEEDLDQWMGRADDDYWWGSDDEWWYNNWWGYDDNWWGPDDEWWGSDAGWWECQHWWAWREAHEISGEPRC